VALAPDDIRSRMDRMYRPQTLVYDLTRKYYLLGRDRLIAEMGARPGQAVLEVGCGTGRNLVAIGRRYPDVRLHGLDAAAPMLEVAEAKLRRAGLEARLTRGVAEELEPRRGDAEPGFDHVVLSYVLSMVDDPVGAVRVAVGALRPGGTLHVVDFGDMAGLPAPAPALMRAWLARFGVRHRPEVEAALRELATAGGGHQQEAASIARGYALLLRFTRA
jgi:S-adenosylmethionine-diacylgycerolhomoserine-N-methlytransferase